MRFHLTILLALSALGCSEPSVDLHLIRSASSPIKSELLEPSPCQHCVERSWIAHDGTTIDLQVEHDPYLSIPANLLSDAEVVHAKGIFQPYCDSFSLSLRVRMSLAEVAEVIDNFAGLPTVVIVEGHAVDAGRHILQGETLTLTFTDRGRAMETAEMIGASPIFREADDHWREEGRQRDLENLKRLFEDPEKLRRFAKETGVPPEDLQKPGFAAQLLCP